MYTYKAIITRVVDGDTFKADIDLGFKIKMSSTFRVLDLDTPETYRPINEAERSHGKQATSRAKELLLGKEVTLFSRKKGKYGRYLCDVILESGENFSEIMKREGLQKRESYE